MRIFLITLFLIFTSNSQAQLLAEPVIGYHFSGKSGVGDKKSVHGESFGGRVGVSALGFMGGIELLTGKLERSGQSSSITANDAGMFLGIETAFGLRTWLNLIFMGTYSYDSSEYDGTGTKIGVGYSPIPFFSLNLEYKNMTYFRLNQKEINDELKMNAWFISVSFPIRL